MLKKQLIDIAIISVINIPFTVYYCPGCFAFPLHWVAVSKAYFIGVVFWIVLWKGNEFMTVLADRNVSWLENPLKRFLVGIVYLLAFTISAAYVLKAFTYWMYDKAWDNENGTIFDSVVITLIVALFLNAKSFLAAWKESVVNAERLKSEHIKTKYEALRNQVNPHFLFNSFNVLIGLIEENKEGAIGYVEKLSEIFRYVLDNRQLELVGLKEELEFIDAYVHLLKIRFGNALAFEKNVEPSAEDYILPLSLQLLVENAIKHNQLTLESPLYIVIEKKDNTLIVRNNMKKKNNIHHSNGVGLENIKERLKIFNTTELKVIEKNGEFVVAMPILSGQRLIQK